MTDLERLGSPKPSTEAQKPREGILVLAAIATMGLAADDSSLAQVFTNNLDRLATQLAETVRTVAGANGQSTQDFAELTAHRESPLRIQTWVALFGSARIQRSVDGASRYSHSTHFTMDAKPGIASAAPSV
jgi:hypothetical protein